MSARSESGAGRATLMVLGLLAGMSLACGGGSDAELVEEAKKAGEKIGKRARKKARTGKKGKKGKRGKGARGAKTRLKLDRPGNALRFAQASNAPYRNGSEGSTLGEYVRRDASDPVRVTCESGGKRRAQWDCVVVREWIDDTTGQVGSGCYLDFKVRDADGQTTVGDMACAQ
jgi:hypothetical protein